MSAVFDMGGYEVYVWGSMALGLAVFAWNVIAPRLQRAALLRRLADEANEDGERRP